MKKILVIPATILSMIAFQTCNNKENPNDIVPEDDGVIIFTDNFEWQVVRRGWEEAPPGMERTLHCDSITCYYSGDTTISNVIDNQQAIYNYHVFLYNQVAVSSGGYTDTSYSSGIYGFLRIDSANNKVYWWKSYGEQDALIYDFNSNIGDTAFRSEYYHETFITSVDTLSVGKYKLKRFILFNNMLGSGDMITGIGSSTGIPDYGFKNFSMVQYELKYFKIDGIKIYTIGN
jgi:hypothetical protein